MPYASRKLTTVENAKSLATAYGERGWNGVSSVCGSSDGCPNRSDVDAWKKRVTCSNLAVRIASSSRSVPARRECASRNDRFRAVSGEQWAVNSEHVHTESVYVGRELGHVEAHLHVRLRAQVVELVGPHERQHAHQRVAVTQVCVVRLKAPWLLRPARVLQARRVEVRRAPHRPVYLRAQSHSPAVALKVADQSCTCTVYAPCTSAKMSDTKTTAELDQISYSETQLKVLHCNSRGSLVFNELINNKYIFSNRIWK